MFNVLVKRDSEELPCPFYVRTQRKMALYAGKGFSPDMESVAAFDLGHLYPVQ